MPSRVEPHSGRVMELLWVQLRLFGGITEHDDRTDVPARICGEMGIYRQLRVESLRDIKRRESRPDYLIPRLAGKTMEKTVPL